MLIRKSFLLSILAAAGALLFVQVPIFAQEEEVVEEEVVEEQAPGETGGEEAPERQGRTFLETLQVGGLAMYPLGALSIGALALIAYNFLAIRPKRLLAIDRLEEVADKAKAYKIDEAREICQAHPSPLTNIADAGLERVGGDYVDVESMEKAMEEASVEELSGPFVYINYLSVIATLSPMVGLLGTVSGMVKAFNTIASKGVGQPTELATNISEALITTATGMIIGIPAMFFYFFFKNKYGKITSSVSRIIGDFHHEFVAAIRKDQS